MRISEPTWWYWRTLIWIKYYYLISNLINFWVILYLTLFNINIKIINWNHLKTRSLLSVRFQYSKLLTHLILYLLAFYCSCLFLKDEFFNLSCESLLSNIWLHYCYSYSIKLNPFLTFFLYFYTWIYFWSYKCKSW